MAYAGIDVGSVNTVVVILDHNGILFQLVVNSEAEILDPLRIMNLAIEKAGIGWREIEGVAATGRGRGSCNFAKKQSSDVVCQARGVSRLFPSARTILNIGAEISRIISLVDNCKVQSFATNDKCAAGSGLFLESMAHLMGVSFSEMGRLALMADSAEAVSSRCAVFAESEVISHIHRGVSKERILAGLHLAVTDRIIDLSRKVPVKPDFVFTGGVARNPAIVRDVEEKLGIPAHIPPEPQIIGALGAALIAQDR